MIKPFKITFNKMTDGIPHVPTMPRHKNREKYAPRPMAKTPDWIKNIFPGTSTILAIGQEVKIGETWKVNIYKIGVTNKVIWVYPIEKINDAEEA